MPAPPSPPSAGPDRLVQVETPEHVAVSYPLADLGSRFAALMLDGLLLLALLLLFGIGIPVVVAWFGGLPAVLSGIGLALYILLLFGVFCGYFVLFEGLRDGQTPGKRRLGLRVVHDGGYPLTLRGAAVRTLLRLADMQPMPTWLVGGVTMLLHPQTKRLGDLAAGTVVVRERAEVLIPETEAAGGQEGEAAAGPPRLDEAEYETLSRFVARRGSLRPEARVRLATQLLERLSARVPGEEPAGSDMAEARLVALHAAERRRRSVGDVQGGSAQAVELVRRQAAAWAAYRALLERARRGGLGSLPEEEVSRFVALYRATAADLARARSYGASAELLRSLERWVGAGHNLLYRPGAWSWRDAREWLGHGFPALVRRRWRPIALAAALLFVPLLLAAAVIHADPARARAILPVELMVRAEEGREREARGQGYVEIPQIQMPVMASGIIANNVWVTFLAFAGGIAAGLGTTATLVFNGVHVGAVMGLFIRYGLGGYLFAFVLPHGIIELTAICIAGGAGLWLGSALVLPGRATRRDALVARGREAVSLLAGAAALLVIAGVIEGFISPAPLPRPLKWAAASAFALLLALYLLGGGRGGEVGSAARSE